MHGLLVFAPLAFIQNLFEGPGLIVLVIFGILLFGRRLPEIGRNVGKTIVEFKKGLNQAKSELDVAAADDPTPPAAGNPYAQKPVISSNKPGVGRGTKQISAASDEP